MDRPDDAEDGRRWSYLEVPALVMTADRPKSRERKKASADGERSPADRGFDRWLNRQLHKLYDPVLEERLPEDLERLLERFDSRYDDSSQHGGDGDRGAPDGKK